MKAHRTATLEWTVVNNKETLSQKVWTNPQGYPLTSIHPPERVRTQTHTFGKLTLRTQK